jgi:hypothetical protein
MHEIKEHQEAGALCAFEITVARVEVVPWHGCKAASS